MKNIALLLFMIMLTITNGSFGQSPPSPPDNPQSGGGPVGGNAPIGSGIETLLIFGAVYVGRKIFQFQKQRKHLSNH